jgi:hypothetical protein
MTRDEIKHAILNTLPTPGVEDALLWEVLSECIAEQTGQQPRLVDLMESVQPTDAHARMRALLEASDTPRSDLKADDHANAPAPGGDPYLPPGDLVGAIRRAAAGYKADGIDLNPTPRAAQMKPITLAESRAELATRIPDPIQRAYVILSERD